VSIGRDPDPTAARFGEMVTLIGAEIGIDAFAAAANSTGREVLKPSWLRFPPHLQCHLTATSIPR
jgi:hypothetical protein